MALTDRAQWLIIPVMIIVFLAGAGYLLSGPSRLLNRADRYLDLKAREGEAVSEGAPEKDR